MDKLTAWRSPRVWAPLAAGIIIAAVLYAMGENDDAPGLVLIGMLSAIILFFWGLYNAASATARAVIPALACWAIGGWGAVFTASIALDGEVSDAPGVGVLIALISAAFLLVGFRFWHTRAPRVAAHGQP